MCHGLVLWRTPINSIRFAETDSIYTLRWNKKHIVTNRTLNNRVQYKNSKKKSRLFGVYNVYVCVRVSVKLCINASSMPISSICYMLGAHFRRRKQMKSVFTIYGVRYLENTKLSQAKTNREWYKETRISHFIFNHSF